MTNPPAPWQFQSEPFSSVQSLSHVWARQASLSITNSQSLVKLMSIELVTSSNHLILLSPSPPAFNFSQHWAFSNESAHCIRQPKHWSYRFSISSSHKYSGLISFRIDWFDLLAVQETLKGFLQRHSSKASILWHSAFLMVQLSHPYMITRKTISLTRWTFVSKVVSLLFNTFYMTLKHEKQETVLSIKLPKCLP